MAATQTSVRGANSLRCRRKFLRVFPQGFYDQKYIDWERGYKAHAHKAWEESLGQAEFRSLIDKKHFAEIAANAVRIESRTNLLFSFEKMALRDALKSDADARSFSLGLYDFLYVKNDAKTAFNAWCETIASLTRKKTRVLTWPVATVFGFIAAPKSHFFLKPTVTRVAARAYGYELPYRSRPSGEIYSEVLRFAALVKRDLSDLRPRDLIDIQSFLWVQGSDEY